VSQPQLILHVGPHKTGSTTLQIRFLAARDQLAQHGVDYPTAGLFQFGHHYLKSFLAGDMADCGDLTEDRLREVGATDRSILFSSENLIYLSAEQLEKLKRLFPRHRIVAVMFIRSPVDLWPSHWQELVKHGSVFSLLDYVGAQFGLNSIVDPRHIHPSMQAARLFQAFGRRNVRIFCFNNIIESGTDLFAYFVATILGIPPVQAEIPTPSFNVSLPGESVEILRCLNEIWSARNNGASPRSAITAAYWDRRAELEATAEFADFTARYLRHARALTLDCGQDFMRRRDKTILRMIGDRIENQAGDDQLYVSQYRRTIPYAPPYWSYAAGLTATLTNLLDTLGA
jgi:hypothetical protein